MSSNPIETLRTVFAQSSVATLATQMGAYLRLVSHPDAQLIDLLDALDRGPVIGDDAARRLHKRLGVPGHTHGPMVRRSYWLSLMGQLGIDPYEFIRGLPEMPSETEAAPAR